MALVDYCRTHTVQEILAPPDMRERVDLYNSQLVQFRQQIPCCSGTYGNVVVIDYRAEDAIYCGNLFLVYPLVPECNVSIHLLRSRQSGTTVLAMGKSILSRTNPVDIGALCLQHGGGGHAAAGT